MHKLKSPSDCARLALALFLFLASFYALTSSGRVRSMDEYMMYDQTESLVLRHSLAIPQALIFHNFFGTYDRFHQPRTVFPPGLALVAAPFYAAGNGVVSAMRLPLAPTVYLLQFAACMTNACIAAAAVTVMFLWLLKLGFSPRTCLTTGLLVAFTTMIWPYSGYFFSEPLALLLIAVAGMILCQRRSESQDSFSVRTQVLVATLLAFAVWVRFLHMFAGLVFCVVLIMTGQRLRPAAIIGAFVAFSFVLYLAYNHYLFGGFFRLGYPDHVEAGRRLTTFDVPAYVGLTGLLFSPGKSVFLYFPIIVPAIWGLRDLWRRSRETALLLGMLPVAYLLFLMTYTEWEGGPAPGPRYLLPPAALLCLAAAPLIESGSIRSRIPVWTAAAAGLFIQIVSKATNFLQAQVGRGYYDASYQYQFAYCQLTVQLQLLWQYFKGQIPHELGLGWDRWFVFLRDGGVPSGFVNTVLTIECLATLMFGVLLFRTFARCQSSAA